MSSTNINIRIESEIKSQAQDVLSKLGLDLTTAVNLFLRQIICQESVSFEVSLAQLTKNIKPAYLDKQLSLDGDFSENQ